MTITPFVGRCGAKIAAWWMGCLLLAGVLPAQSVETIFAFGDSYTDSGAGYVDGDGPTAIVYVARDLGLPFTHAADPDAAGKGLNFAVSGARTGEGEGRKVKESLLGRGMLTQVADFADRVRTGAVRFDPARTVFFIAGGLNDRTLPTAATVENLSNVVGGLHAAGARKFLLAILPTKIPAFAAVGERLNPALAQLPADLQARYPDADIRSSKWGAYFDAVMIEPAKFGIANTTDPCAGRALFDQDAAPRGDPATYYYYHEGHPSTAVQRKVADELKREVTALFATPARPVVLEATVLDEVPVPLLQPKPAVPAGVAGGPAPKPVEIAVVVDAQGAVREANVVQPGQVELDRAAVAILPKWRFRPGRKDGRAVDSRLIVAVTFSLPEAENTGPFAGPSIVPVDQLDRAPMVRYQAAPAYPADLRRRGIGGEVLVEFVIDEHGIVRSPRVIRSPHEGLGEAAENAVGQWTFFPGMKAGRAVATRLQVPIEFTPAP